VGLSGREIRLLFPTWHPTQEPPGAWLVKMTVLVNLPLITEGNSIATAVTWGWESHLGGLKAKVLWPDIRILAGCTFSDQGYLGNREPKSESGLRFLNILLVIRHILTM
jgi:hypothetical protein